MLDQFDDDRDDAPRGHRRSESGRSILAMAGVVLLFGLLAVGGWWGYNTFIGGYGEDYPGDGNGVAVDVEIVEGSTIADMGNVLFNSGVTASAQAFVSAASDNEEKSTLIQPGIYQLEQEMSAQTALDHLANPENRIVNGITLTEGHRYFDTLEELAEFTEIPLEDFEEAASDPIARGVPEFWFDDGDGGTYTESIEGFLYPATYEIDEGATAEEILEEMVARFNNQMEEINFLERMEEIDDDVTPMTVLHVAAIVEGESGNLEDDPKIARVMYNRLYHPDAVEELGCNCLGTEAVWNYGNRLNGDDPVPSGDMDGTEMHDEDNPWAVSSSANAGLAPTPIGSPGLDKLEGALEPTEGEDWQYFVTAFPEDMTALFADTYEEHQANVETAVENGIQLSMRAAVLGSPIEHSLSPIIHNAGYEAAGLTQWQYSKHEVTEDGLQSFIESLDAAWAGLSLTMPLKEKALDVADEVRPIARLLGAANTLTRRGDQWIADNTDAGGLVDALSEAGVCAGGRIAILGAGGTARAALGAAAQLGAESVTVFARRSEAIDQLRPAAEVLALPLTGEKWDYVARASDADIVISTVPKGIADSLAITWNPQAVVFDVLYDPWPTPLAESAQAAGCLVIPGHELLLAQAVRQWKQFTGLSDAPVDEMRSALEIQIRSELPAHCRPRAASQYPRLNPLRPLGAYARLTHRPNATGANEAEPLELRY